MQATLVADFLPPPSRLNLSELAARHGPFDLLKLDIEGVELPLLAAEADFLSTFRGMLWIECNEATRSLELAELLIARGLKVHYFAFPSFNRTNYAGDPEELFPFAYEAGLLVGSAAGSPILDADLVEQGCILRPIASRDDLKRALWLTPRWGERDWINAGREEIVALAGRSLRREGYDDFLIPEARPVDARSPMFALQERLDRTEAAFRHAERLTSAARADATRAAGERDAALARAAALSAQIEMLERAKTLAESLASERLALLGHARVAMNEARAKLAEIETSTIWRASLVVRSVLARHPRMRALLRRGARAAHRFMKP